MTEYDWIPHTELLRMKDSNKVNSKSARILKWIDKAPIYSERE